MQTNIYAITDSHQESRNLSKLLSGIYNFEKNNKNPFLIFDCGDLFKGIYDKELSVNAYLKLKQLLPQAEIFITLGNNDFGFNKSDFEYLKNTVKVFQKAGINVVCSNIFDSKTENLADWLSPYKILKINGLKILITGFCISNSCAKKFGIDLKPQEKIYENLINSVDEDFDKVIVLNHHWYSYSLALKNFSQNIRPIDLIIGGHEHSRIEPDYKNNIFYPLSFARAMYKVVVDDKIEKVEEISLKDVEYIPEFENPIIKYEQETKLKEPIAKRVLDLKKNYSEACSLGTFLSDNMKKVGNTDIAFHSTGFTMYSLRLDESEFITKYDIERVICAQSTIEKININVEQLKKVFDNTALNRMYKDRGNTRFLQCSGNISVFGKGNIQDKTYKIVQIKINGESLLDDKGEPINPKREFSCAIDPFIGSGEQGFEVLKNIPKEKILVNGKEVPMNELFRNALINADKNFDGKIDYPNFEYVDLNN
ncbi:5'-nucleotidase C-terminal domain-containing protein [bacterium]|nr:5'-nucleotidase C-terminal domain-containing protein [bacterium]